MSFWSPPATRIAAAYAGLFLFVGVQLPFWSVWLKSLGLGEGEIGVLLAVGSFVRVLGNPLVAGYADQRGRVGATLVIVTLASLLMSTAFFATRGFWPLLAASVLFAFLSTPIVPLCDSLALRRARIGELAYGPVRAFGSITFAVAAMLTGTLVERYSAGVVPIALTCALAIGAVSLLTLPRTQPEQVLAPPRSAPVRDVMGDRTFLLLILIVAVLFAGHSVYNGFSSLIWREAGIDDDTIGQLWATGVVGEVAFFACGSALAARLGIFGLVCAGALAGVMRWSVNASSVSVPVLFATQLLHGVTFGMTHLGVMTYVQRRMPSTISATAQSVYGGIASGLAMGVGMLFTGDLVRDHGCRAFWFMAGLAAIGLIGVLCLYRALVDVRS